MLLAVVKFGLTYCLPFAAMADLLKMINYFFGNRILPETKYFIDKLFNPKDGMTMHALCPNCKKYVKKFDEKEKTVKCRRCQLQINVKDPTYRDFFVTFNIRSQVKSLIEKHEEYYNMIMTMPRNGGFLQDIYDGSQYKKLKNSLPENERNSFATMIFNTDGAAAFKSSTFSVWPILLVLNEIPIEDRQKNQIVYGLWFGKDKPNLKIFLKQFEDEMNELSAPGITCNILEQVKKVKLYVICACVDSIARAPMQCFHQFNGEYGCGWCLHPGISVQHSQKKFIKYPILNIHVENRTTAGTLSHLEERKQQQALAEEQRNRRLEQGEKRAPTHAYGVKDRSPLLELSHFDFINGFVPDVMHCVLLGVAKQFAHSWFAVRGKLYSLPEDSIKQVDSYLKSLKVPQQLTRLSRSIGDRKHWKAREWENWLLFYSLPVLLELPGFEEYAAHWSHLVEALFILSQNSIPLSDIDKAEMLLKEFQIETQRLYGYTSMTYNVHQLIHLVQSVVDFGPLWAHNCFCFESMNGILMKKIKSAKGVLHQICRSILMNQSLIIFLEFINPRSGISEYCHHLDNREEVIHTLVMRHGRYFNVPQTIDEMHLSAVPDILERPESYHKFVKCKCLYTSCTRPNLRSDNSIAHLTDNTFVKIFGFIVDRFANKEFVICKKISTTNAKADDMCSFIKKIININEPIVAISPELISCVCVLMPINDSIYLASLPNLHHV